MHRSLFIFAACLCSCLSGCQVVLNRALSKAPNQYLVYRWSGLTEPHVRSSDLSHEFCVQTGPRAVTLWVGVVDPCGVRPRGTVLILHGTFSGCSRSPGNAMFKSAECLAEAGYRAVLVDLRGHGRSGGDFITGGPLEAQEIGGVIDALSQRQLLVGKTGVLSYSLGAGIALHLAAKDPRVNSVVAVAAPLRLRESVPHTVWTGFPVTRRVWSDENFQQAINVTGDRVGEDPDAADTELAICRTRIPILLVHSTDDEISPISTGERLRAAANGNAEIVPLVGSLEVPNRMKGHAALLRDESGVVKGLAIDWFGRTL